MPSDVLITPASSKVEFTDGSNATKTLRITGTSFSFDSDLGIGITSPTSKLNVLSTTSLSSVFKAEGVNGTLFEVTDDLSNSLMSVNTIGGLPVFEVFANNTIVAGQYNANDFVISGNKVGIGNSSPNNKLHVAGSASIGLNYNVAAPTNGLIVEGNVGVGLTNPSTYSSQLTIETTQSRAIMAFNTALADAGTIYGLGFGYAMSNYNSAYISFYKVGNSNTLNRLSFSLWNQNDILNILGNGNVGVGITNPNAKFYVSAGTLAINQRAMFINADITTNTSVYTHTLNLIDSSTNDNPTSLALGTYSHVVFRNRAITAGSVGGVLDIYTRDVAGNPTVKMTVTDVGNVGIGNTAPLNKLHVAGSASVGSSYNVAGPTNGLIVEGSVGIGTTNPAAKLAIGANPTYAAGVTLIVGTPGNPSSSGTSQPYANLRLGTNTGNSQVLDFGIYDASPYGSWIQAAGGGNLAFPSPLVLNPTGGNIGIGVSNPTALLTIYNTSFDNNTDGFKFGYSSAYHHSFSASFNSSASLNNLGININNGFNTGRTRVLTLLGNGNIGIGITSPSAVLHVNSAVSGATLLRADGTNGTLFSVVDDLSDSLMSVNNSAGLPVLEVFADDRIVAGQYGQNDLVVINNKVGLGTNNPVNKLSVLGSVSIGSGYNTAAPTNGLIVQGDVGIGVTTFAFSSSGRGNLEIYGSTDSLIGLRNSSGNAYIQKYINDLYINNVTNGALAFSNNGSERWRITNAGVLQSNAAQTIQTSTDNLTLATAAGNGHILLTPHGTGNVGIGVATPSVKLEVQGNGQFGNDSVTTVGLKLTRLIGGTRTSEHTFHSANNSPWYTYGQNLTWTGELAGTVESSHAYRPYFEGFAPAAGYKIFGFMNVNTGSFTSANIINALVIKNDGNVGIGTTSPTGGGLHVYGASGATGVIRLQSSDGRRYDIGSTGTAYGSANNFIIYDITASAERFRLQSDGNIGIGTTSASGILHLYGSNQRMFITSTSDASQILFGQWDGSTNRIESSNRKLFLTSYSGGISFGINGSDDIFLTTNRNLGVGFTSAVNNKLAVNGTASIGSNYNIAAPANGLIVEGNVGIGSSSPTQKLDVYSTNQDVARFYNNQTTFGLILGSTSNSSFVNLLWQTSTGNAQFFKNRSSSSWGGADSFNFYSSNGGFAFHPNGVANKVVISAGGDLTVNGSTSSNFIYPNGGVTGSDLFAQDVILSAYHHGDSLRYDALQFNAPNTYETRATVGSSFVSTTVDTSIFKGDSFGGAVLIPYGTYQVRWTWNDVGYRYFNLLYLGYSATGHSFTVLVEKSSDGVTWTQQYTSGSMGGWPGHGWYTAPWHNSGVTRLRITLTPTWDAGYSAYDINLYNMRYFCTYPLNGVNRLFDWDYSRNINFNGNIGIGVANPTAKLDIAGTNVNGYSLLLRSGDNYNQNDSVQIAFGFANQTNYRHSIRTRHNPAAPIGGVVGNNIDFYVWKRGTDAAADLGSQFVMTMQGDGAVGIGTTNPLSPLEIYKVPATSTTLQTMLTINTDFASASGTGFGGSIIFKGRTAGNELQDNAQISAYNEDAGDNGYALGFYTRPTVAGGLTQRMTILRGGNVGIGIINPTAILNVKTSTQPNREVFMGDSAAVSGVFRARLDDNSLSFISLENRDTAATTDHGVGIRFNLATSVSNNAINAGGIYLGKEQQWTATASTQDSYLAFATSLDGTANEKVRIKSDGNVGIGVTSPNNKLHVNGSMSVGSGYNTAGPTNGLIVQGSVGIGISSPSYTLDVQGGSVRIAESGTTYNSNILFGNDQPTWGSGIRVYDNGDAELRIWHRNTRGQIVLATGYNGNGATSMPTDGLFIIGDTTATPSLKVGIGYTAANLRGSGTKFAVNGNVGIGLTSSTSKLNVLSSTSLSSVFKAEGINGTLFEVTDDLSNSLMSVNTIGGLPVFEVFANNTIIAGQYGANDFVINGNKIGVGTANPSFKLDVNGTLGVNAGTSDGNWPFIVVDTNTAGGTNRYALNKIGAMGFNYPDSYAQLQLVGANGAYIDFNNAAVDDFDARIIYYSNTRFDFVYGTTMTINSTGVGIGTSTPGYLFAVNNGSDVWHAQFGQVGGNQFRIGGNTTNGAVIGAYSDNTNNNPRQLLLNRDGGNVGIGISNALYRLHVNGTGYFNSTLQVNSNITLSGGGDVIINDSDGTGFFASFMDSGVGYIRIDDGGTANGTLNINSGTLFVGPSSGNVGIGTVTPGYKLDVNGNGRVGDAFYVTTATTGDAKIEIGNGRSGNGNSYIDLVGDATYTDYGLRLIRSNGGPNTTSAIAHRGTGILYITAVEAASIALETSNTTRVTINSSGNVGIGTTSPVAKLDTLGVRLGRDFSLANRATVRLDANGAAFPSDILFGHTTTANQDGWNGVYWSLSSRGTANSNRFYFYRGSGNPAPNNSEAVIMSFDPTLNVGIGFEAPTNRLSIAGSVSIGSGYNTAAPTDGLIVQGNVGIGISSPLSKLHLVGSHVGGSGFIRLEASDYPIISLKAPSTGDGSAGYWGVRAQDTSNNDLMFYGYRYTPAFSGFWIDPDFGGVITKGFFVKRADGNVGIGINTPSSRLHINSTTSGATLLRADGTNGTLFSVVDDLSDSLMSVNNSAGLPVLEVFADDRVVAGQYGANDFVLVNNKLGLGTNNPQYELDIVGPGTGGSVNIISRIRSTASSNIFDTASVIAFTNTTTNTNAYSYIGSRIDLGGAGDNAQALVFATNATNALPTEKMRIKSDGNVGIGTNSPVGKLDVRAGSGGEIIFGTYDANYVVKIQSGDQLNFYNGASPNPGYINYGGGATVLSQNLHVEKATGGTTGLVRIKADGKVGIGTTAPATLLQINTGTPQAATGGIQFGDDTGARLYRSNTATITCSGTIVGTFSGTATNATQLGGVAASSYVRNDVDGTDSTALFRLKTITKSLTVTTSWIDTGIVGADLPDSGAYILTLNVDNYAVNGGHYNETYAGIMYWFSGGTNDLGVDEIPLHKSGHAPNGRYINLRTVRQYSGGTNLKLQIISNVATTGASNYIFKFRRMI